MNRDLEVALEAARAGGELIRSYRRKSFDVRYKGRNDLVTEVDLAAEKEIFRVIRDHFPDDRLLGEESEGIESLSGERVWIVDPIDGTTNFAYGFPVYCVSVGLWDGEGPLAAAVLELNLDETYTAARGAGASLNGEPIRVSEIAEPSRALIGTGFPYNDYRLLDEYVTLFRRLMDDVQGLRRPGSAAYDLCCVAAGRFQGFYEYALKAWDVAAAALIIQEAGGVITDWNGGDEWLFGERIIAGNEPIHRFLLETIGREISAENRVR